jgi:hypothetical protein
MISTRQPTTALAASESGAVKDQLRNVPPKRPFRAFCLVLIGIPIAGLSLMVAFGHSDLNMLHSDVWLRNLDHAYSYRNQQCDVVMYGDSTVITGFDPKIVSAATGLTACNLGETGDHLTVLGTETLDNFLERNPPPRYLIIQLGTENFRFQTDWSRGLTGEAILQLVRHRPAWEIAEKLALHPNETLQFATWMYANFRAISPREYLHPSATPLTPVNGFFLYPLPPETHCQAKPPIPEDYKQPDPAWINSLRARYSRTGTRLLIDVSPMPDCDRQLAYYQRAVAGLTDNQLESWPIAMFNEGDRHFSPDGSARRSLQVANQILEFERGGKGAL